MGLGIGALQQQGAQAQVRQVDPLALHPRRGEAAGGDAGGAHLAVIGPPCLGAGGQGGSAGKRRYLSALLSARDAWIKHLNAVYCALMFMGPA